MKYYNKNINDILKEFSSTTDGLLDRIIESNKLKYGKNIIEEKKGKSALKRFLDQFKDMMIIILIIVAIIMFIYGFLYTNDYVDTIVIAVVVLVNAIMGYIQEQKAEVTLQGLKKYSSSMIKVKRNGNIENIDSKEIVCGDIIILESGDKVPADSRIIEATNLKVDESPLTGESVSISKNETIIHGDYSLQEQKNMLFSGTNIVNGSAKAIVVKTGMNTELGKIALSLNTPYEVITPLQLKIKEISKKITIIIFVILLFLFLYGVLKGYEIMKIIMLCASLAVAAIPEGLPAVITIALSAGTTSLAKKRTVVRQMSAVETLGSTDIICSDKTGTITQNKMQVRDCDILDSKMIKYVAILANETIVDEDNYIGDPTESCLYDYFCETKEEAIEIRKKHNRINSNPFDSGRKMMSSINEIDGKKYLLVKGSLESILDNTKNIKLKGKVVKIKKTDIEKYKSIEENMASKALRVLGFAYKEITEDKADETNLTYIGMIGIVDPPRENVKKAVAKCRKAGIRPVMITGDSFITACAVAKEVGIIKDDSEGILGEELDNYSDEELQEIVKKYNVYVRVSPAHKLRIVKAWQDNGKVVAMTGDGVNDAPAIKDAHVGIGMGITGTEVTKSVADIILLDDSFSTIVDAIEEGRRIFINIRNNVVYSLSSNFAELFIVLIGMFTDNTILLPIHILFIDLITDTIPSICLSLEKAEKGIMNKPPRGIDKPIFTPFVKACIVYSALVETMFALLTFFVASVIFDSNVAITLALLTVVAQELFYAISCRNLKDSILEQGLFSNKAMNKGLIIVFIIELIFFATPIGSFIDIAKIDFKLICIVFLINIIGLFFYELGKPVLKKLFKD